MTPAEKELKFLVSLGWTPELLAIATSPSEMGGVDRRFRSSTMAALAKAGYSPLEFFAAHPNLSIDKLVKRLGHKASVFGLLMVIYEEAARKKVVRAVAKDLLLRQLSDEFPEGWVSDGSIHPAVRIGCWDRYLSKCTQDKTFSKYASEIIRHLAIDHPPPAGWRPQAQNDPLIDELFDRYWPVTPEI